jgi:hypothetical protein
MLGDFVTTEAPPTPGLEARRRLPARLGPKGTLVCKLVTTTDHKVIAIMYLVASFMRGMTAADASSCGRLAQVPDGFDSSVRPLHRVNRSGTWSWRCHQHTGERSCSQVAGDD